MSKKYMVHWTDQVRKEDYELFNSGNSELNYQAALERYNELVRIRKDDMYIINLCEILQSTDY